MDDRLSIPAGSLRTIWLFRVDLPDDALKAFETVEQSENGETRRWPLGDALGDWIAEDAYELFKAETLSEYSLSRYLTDAHGMDDGSVAPDAARLDALRGPLLLVHSAGIGEDTYRLDPVAPLSLVGRYTETVDFTVRIAPDSASAAGPVSDPPVKTPSPAALSGRIAMVALLVLFALVGLMIWVAG